MAEQLERYAEAEAPRERGILTQTVNRLSRYAQHLSQRHRRRNES